jgi:hypothetical protein
MNKCYKLIKFTNKNYLFKNVEAIYIIHLEGNGRLQSVINQLQNYKLTKEVYILFNKGYKKCEKDKHIILPRYDLIDCFFYIMKDAQNKQYNNILILEDDFIFNKDIQNTKITNHIDNFLLINENKLFLYYIGALPYLQIPTFNQENILMLSSGAHSIIYPKTFINYINTINKKKINDWDVYLNLNFKRYIYYKPLCYQLFPETENSKNCINSFYITKPLLNILFNIFKILKLDKQIDPGYTIMYNFSIYLFYIIVLIILFLSYYYIKYNN